MVVAVLFGLLVLAVGIFFIPLSRRIWKKRYSDNAVHKLQRRKDDCEALLRTLKRRSASSLDMDIVEKDIADIQFEIERMGRVV